MRTMAKATTAAVSLDTAFTGELEGWQNDSDQWLAATGLSTPLGFIASPLHRMVRPTAASSDKCDASESARILSKSRRRQRPEFITVGSRGHEHHSARDCCRAPNQPRTGKEKASDSAAGEDNHSQSETRATGQPSPPFVEPRAE
jgi:hypothetical protein